MIFINTILVQHRQSNAHARKSDLSNDTRESMAPRDAVDDRRRDYERTCPNAAAKVGSSREANTR